MGFYLGFGKFWGIGRFLKGFYRFIEGFFWKLRVGVIFIWELEKNNRKGCLGKEKEWGVVMMNFKFYFGF